jgi:DNA-binding transcriptional LysR family regulator
MDRIAGMQLFVRAVESGSFSRAASDLNLTQPTVTKHIAALEAQLGVRLLNRNTRGIGPTEIGRLYYEKCKAILQQIDEAEHIATERQGQVHGTLRIGSSVAFGRRVVTPLVLEFMQRHPQLRIDLSFVDTYVNLVEQGIDVAIRMGKLADSSLGARYLGTNPWVMVASPTYLKRHGAPRTPDDLARHNVLFYSTVLGDDRLHFVAPNAQRLTVAANGSLRSNSLSSILAAVRAHMGVAALPYYVAAVSLAEGKVVEVLGDHTLPAQEINAVFASPKQVPAKVTTLIGYLQDFFQGDWWRRVS